MSLDAARVLYFTTVVVSTVALLLASAGYIANQVITYRYEKEKSKHKSKNVKKNPLDGPNEFT